MLYNDYMNKQSELAIVLFEHMKRHGISAAKMGCKVGVHPATIKNFLNGKKAALASIVKIEEYLDSLK